MLSRGFIQSKLSRLAQCTSYPPPAAILLLGLLIGALQVGCVRPLPDNETFISGAPQSTGTDTSADIAQENEDQPNDAQNAYPSAPREDSPSDSESEEYFILHTIEAGDTLSTIAERYDTSMAELMALNQIGNSDFIIVGETLRVPGPDFESLVSPTFEIIPDSELVYGPSAKDFDLASTVTSQGGYLSTHLEEVEGKQMAGTEIVALVAERHSVNPKLLLALIEYQSGWLTESMPGETVYPMGYEDEDTAGLYKQLSWAANLLNWGFYGRSEGGVTSFLISDEIPLSFAEDIGLGTSGVQFYLASRDGIDYETLLFDAGPVGVYDTYSRLFGDPFQVELEDLFPDDLSQPPMMLPWSSGETWYFTGGPHGGWNTGSAWAALDFVPPNQDAGCNPSDSWTTAVADGVISRSGHGAVVLDLDGDGYSGTGWAITYMHLDDRDRIAMGTRVKIGDPLGHPGCEGGFTNGTHVHLARMYNGRWISADGDLPFNLGGWISQGEGFEYNGALVREGIVKTADIFHTDENAITAD